MKIGTVRALDKNIPVYKHGHGGIPLLIVGPANLFKKAGMLPEAFNSVFTIYFVDLFEKINEQAKKYENLTLTDFIDQLENIRNQLGVHKIALFGHSAAGILALEYAVKYKERVLFNILVGVSLLWGDYKNKLVNSYFRYNSDEERQQLFKLDQQKLIKPNETKQAIHISFRANYDAKRALFFYNPLLSFWENIWNDINLDEELVNHYFSLLKDYEISSDLNFSGTPTFLGLGLYDYSCPFYSWTDDAKKQLASMECYIFEASAHYPQIEQMSLFCEKIFEYMEKNKIIASTANTSSKIEIRL